MGSSRRADFRVGWADPIRTMLRILYSQVWIQPYLPSNGSQPYLKILAGAPIWPHCPRVPELPLSVVTGDQKDKGPKRTTAERFEKSGTLKGFPFEGIC